MGVFLLFVLDFLLLKSCLGDYDKTEDLNGFLFGKQTFNFVDLSQSTNRDVEKDAFTEDYRNLSHTCLNERLGTGIHVMSGYVTFKNQNIIRDLPLEKLILPLIIADISDKVNGDGKFVLHNYHLDYFLNNYFGNTKQPCLIVFKFGWSRYFNDRHKYCGTKEDKQSEQSLLFPGISEQLAKWITTSYKNVVGIGVDLPAVDPGSSTNFQAFEILVNAGVYVLTNVKLDQYVPEASCTAIVLPPKIMGLGSSPLRLVAVCPKSRMEKPIQIFLP